MMAHLGLEMQMDSDAEGYGYGEDYEDGTPPSSAQRGARRPLPRWSMQQAEDDDPSRPPSQMPRYSQPRLSQPRLSGQSQQPIQSRISTSRPPNMPKPRFSASGSGQRISAPAPRRSQAAQPEPTGEEEEPQETPPRRGRSPPAKRQPSPPPLEPGAT